ncbi:MAG: hypothetical protein IV100_17485, partial [Myxococcales bacterium]|nr:hypothetical protein [Myxococcales bacterium]
AEFGGFRIALTAKNGDRLMVAPAPDLAAGVTEHAVFANRLFVFTSSTLNCTSSCGSYWQGDTNTFYMSKHTVSTTINAGITLVGSAVPQDVSARLIHSRLGTGWGGGTAHQDNDGDTLTWELESQKSTHANVDVRRALTIDTCDTSTGPSTDCAGGRQYSQREAIDGLGTWDASDTDNDGYDDAWEIFGLRRGCTKVPMAPFYDPGDCNTRTWSTPPEPYLISASLAALDADPRETDLYLQVDRQATSTSPFHNDLSDAEWESIRRIYSEEGLECEGSTSTACGETNRVRFHRVPGATVPAMPHDRSIYRSWPAFDWFNKWPHSFRKYTGVFRFGQLLTVGDFAWGADRVFVGYGSGISDGPPAGRRFTVTAHEIGHSAGLAHGGLDNDDSKANYPSLMSYGFGALPVKYASGATDTSWPGTAPGASCATDVDCAGGVCLGTVCEVDCERMSLRFSRGQSTISPWNETSPMSTGLTANFAAALRCYLNGARRSSWVPACAGSTCSVTLPTPVDLNSDTDTSDTALTTTNDWAAMYDRISNAINVYPAGSEWNKLRRYFRVYQSLFDGGSASDLSAWGQTVSTSGTLTTSTDSPGSEFGGSINFGSSGLVTVASSSSLETIGNTVDGKVPRGFRFDVHVRFDAFGSSFEHLIAQSDLFEIFTVATSDPGCPSATCRYISASVRDGSTTRYLTAEIRATVNQWYWVVLQNVRDEGEARLYVSRWVPPTAGWSADTTNATDAACAAVSHTLGDRNPGALRLGRHSTLGTYYQLDGNLDHVRLTNYPTCLYNTTPSDDVTSARRRGDIVFRMRTACGSANPCGHDDFFDHL